MAAGPPVVCVDRLLEGLNTDSVCVDGSGAAKLGVKHLLSLGHRRIAIITGPLTLRNEQERLRGYRRALKDAGLPVHPSLIWSASPEMEEIHAVCQRGLLRQNYKPTALFATNGVTGLCALKSLYSLGFTTPDSIAFVTFGELIAEDFFQPRITSVVPTYEIGHPAVEVLFDRIVNFGRGHVKPNLSLDASVGADLWKTDRFTARLQADAEHINKRSNLLDFAGLFFGTAIELPRSYALRLTNTF
ncbi:MAG TPA: substrate-binding domain-containing protein [Candidatus Limnocylindria bacterium]|nr:substrate-binding domain-containing protein [Candidatus Limnocylindria bacterium]